MIASLDERGAFASQINTILEPYRNSKSGHAAIKDYLPVTTSNLLERLRDGVILAYLLDNLEPGCISLNQLVLNLLNESPADAKQDDQQNTSDQNIKIDHRTRTLLSGSISDPTTIFRVTANLNLVINAARSLRQLVIVNLGAQDILDGKEDLVLGLLWQVLRASLLAKVNLGSHAELVRLLEPGESLAGFAGLRPEAILLRWFNYHLVKAGCGELITNFGQDLADGRLLGCLVEQIYGIRADTVDSLLDNLRQAGLELDGIDNAHLQAGHPRMNLMLIAKIFNHRIGIHLPSEEESKRISEERDALVLQNATLATQLAECQSQLATVQAMQTSQTGNLEALKLERARELEQIHSEFRTYKDDLAQSMQMRLQERLQEASMRYQEERRHLQDRIYELSSAMQSVISLISPHVNGEAVLRENKLRPFSAEGEHDEGKSPSYDDSLSRALGLLVRILLERALHLEETTKSLRTDLEAKTKVNEVMGQKIRQYTENLIQSKKAAEAVPVNSPLGRLTRILSTRTIAEKKTRSSEKDRCKHE